ncbi:MAG: BadF/BadG/BcrA/BcrD ATPase family protein, partial [Spirochaetota bacterium]
MVTAGIDIGSTTLKAIVMDQQKNVLWKKYQRHRARQAEKVAEFLEEIRDYVGAPFRLFTTGSGGSRIAGVLGTKYYQEVNALCCAIENFHPDAGSVFELGGQDAKFIVWNDRKGKFATMNDRCAGGTGATIDRIIMKLNLTEKDLSDMSYTPQKVYPVAGKCGVFAETDINSLQK